MSETLRVMWEAMAPGVLEFAGVLLMLALTWAFRRLGQVFGLAIEAQHREALHSALMSGVMAALQRNDRDTINSAIDHAKASTPDAIRSLGASDGVMRGIAQRLLAQQRR